MDDTGIPIVAQIKIKLSLMSEPAANFMESVDVDVSRLDGVLLGTSGHVDNAVSVVHVGSRAIRTLGTCDTPLGQALQLIVKLMDSIADVSCAYLTSHIYQWGNLTVVANRRIRY
jgi:hypothetical protein